MSNPLGARHLIQHSEVLIMQNEFYQDLFASFGDIKMRKMFGVAGIYCDGLFFAIIADNELWLKVDTETRAAFEAIGAEQFIFEMKKKSSSTPYYKAPEDIFDDEDNLHYWTQLALGAALRNKTSPKSKKRAR
ncbi:TfoX family protein [Alteromonadaceae bacterium M269]|nr:TfoX family protein [Alteromonadaceae bacterium M269]